MVISAAVKIHIYEKDINMILSVHHHKDARRIMSDLGFTDYDYHYGMEGFLTDDGQFLDCRSAADHAYECGQLIETTEESRIDKLMSMSEDLW